jgi:cytochrome bd-type quinol oxidase subunit 2
MQKIKRLITGALATLAFAFPLLAMSPVAVAATDIQKNLCAGADLDVNSTSNCQTSDATGKINSLLTNIINIFSLIVGVVAVIMIIIGGLRYILSGGDSGNITSAKNTILYAIIGLVIVAMAQFIVKFVLAKVAGTS